MPRFKKIYLPLLVSVAMNMGNVYASSAVAAAASDAPLDVAIRAAASSASSSTSEPQSFGLTTKRYKRFSRGMQIYMLKLCQSCKYRNNNSESFKLPEEYFEKASSVAKSVQFSDKGVVSVSKALDALATISSDKEKYFIECALAASFTLLAGYRAIINDDAVFDNMCKDLITQETRTFGELTSKHLMIFIGLNFMNGDESATPTLLANISQLKSPAYFSFRGTLQYPTLQKLLTAHGETTTYFTKHCEGNMQGINMIEVGNDQYVYFEPGMSKPVTLETAARSLISAMNADLSEHDKKNLKTKASAYQSIKYSNDEAALRIISDEITYATLDLSKIIKTANLAETQQKKH